MASTRRTAWTAISVVYLLTLTALAAYALHTTNDLSLPVPDILPALALALPPLTGLALEISLSMTTTRRTKNSLHVRPLVLQIVSAVFLVYETVLASVAGTHLAPPGSLDCALREQWQSLVDADDQRAIDRLQSRLDCAGLALNHVARTDSCLEPWKEAERRVAGILLAVAIGTFVWQILFLYIGPDQTPSWLPSTIRLPQEDSSDTDRTTTVVTRGLNADSQLASDVEGARERDPRLRDDGY